MPFLCFPSLVRHSNPLRLLHGNRRSIFGWGESPRLVRPAPRWRGPTVPFEALRVGHWYEAKSFDKEVSPRHGRALRYMSQAEKLEAAVPHRVLVLGLNPLWKIVRFASCTTFAGQSPSARFDHHDDHHPGEKYQYIPIGTAFREYDVLRGQSHPPVIEGWLRLDSVCSVQYGVDDEDALLSYLKTSVEGPAGGPKVEIISPSWVLGYYKDMSRAWADNIYGGKGFDGIPQLLEEYNRINAIYRPQADAVDEDMRERARQRAEDQRIRTSKLAEERMKARYAEWCEMKRRAEKSYRSRRVGLGRKRRRMPNIKKEVQQQPKWLQGVELPKKFEFSQEVKDSVPKTVAFKPKPILAPEIIRKPNVAATAAAIGAATVAASRPKAVDQSGKGVDMDEDEDDDDYDDDDDDDGGLYFGPIRDHTHLH
ncbi:hypothetical protein BZA77DRAFT_307710 [Pyronema omphalodes]|nr:hypothetical protein BZA77DRAFT_307710 [Pyronema omphalodes]